MENIEESKLHNKLITKMKIYNEKNENYSSIALFILDKFVKINKFPKSFDLYDLADFFSKYDYPELENDVCVYSLMEYPLKKENIDVEKTTFWHWTSLFLNIDRYNYGSSSFIGDLKVIEIKENGDFFKIGKNIDELFYIKHAIERKKVFSNSVKVVFGGLDVSDSSVFYYIDCEITENGSIRIKKHTSVIKIPLFDKWYHFLHYRRNKYYIIDLKETSVDIVLPYEKFLKFTKNIPEIIQYDQNTI